MMYRSIAIIKLKEEFAYKYRAIFSLIGSILSVIVLWYLWNAVFASSPETAVGSFTLTGIITYTIVSSALRGCNSTMFEYSMESDVKTGFIATELTKPYNYMINQFFVNLGEAAYRIITIAIPMLMIGYAFFSIGMPANTPAFLISAILGFMINFSMSALTGLWAFWTIGGIWGLRHSRQVISDMISGSIIPLSFFPVWLADIADLLPFKAIYGTPLSIFVGQISGEQMYYAILQQIVWVMVLFSMICFIWKRAERKVVVQGG